MTSIDLNSDLGENVPSRIVSDDESMLRLVTSANVSCGFHAGSPEGIRETLAAAVQGGVVIGAHPGYRDYENFGRTKVDIDSATLQAHVEYQLGALIGLAAAVGGRVAYVKPHGALYNTACVDPVQADAVTRAVADVDPSLAVLALPGSELLRAAEHHGLRAVTESFADRAYEPDGSLVPRSRPGAVLHDPDLVAARVLRMVTEGVATAVDGSDIPVRADSVCVHGDSPDAVAMARAIRALLTEHGITIATFTPAP